MLHGFFRLRKAFEEAGLADPTLETLRLLDIVSNGAVRGLEGDILAELGTDLQTLIARRQGGEPLEYVLGRTTFMGLQFSCAPAALIPRQETELLARTALEFIRRLPEGPTPPLVVDMGTGSGNLAVAMAVHAPHIRVVASDVSPEAVELARGHVDRYGLASRLTLFCGDLFAPLDEAGYRGRVDVVVCNPPYIPNSSLAKLAPEIINHEPVTALDAGAYGLDIFRRLIADSPLFLKPGGVLVFEIGEGQERFVERLLDRSGFYDDIRQHQDGRGKVRVMSAVGKG